MKKLFTLLVIFGTSLMPLSASLAQTPQNVDMWGAASQLATLENARTTESIYGDFEIEESSEHVIVDYKIDLESQRHNVGEASSSTQIKAEVNIVNQNEESDDDMPFKSMAINATGEIMALNEKDLYLKLTDVTFKTEGGEKDTEEMINERTLFINLLKGNWYHASLEELYGEEFGDLTQKDFLETLKKDSKQAIKDMIKEEITQQVKQNQYYAEVFGEDDTITPVEVEVTTEDYTSYLTAEVKANPVDLVGLVEKGVLECDGDMYKGEGMENGFQYPSCWPAVSYQGELTAAEDALMNQLYAYNGKWIYEDGKWYYVEIYGSDEAPDYQNVVSQEEFEYDQKAIDEEVSKIMRGVDSIFDTPFFNQRNIISGPNEGFKFYNLNRAMVLKAAKDFGQLMGEEMTTYEEEEIEKTLRKISLAGVYNIREDNQLLDHLFARFRYHDDDFMKKFEMNYSFKLTDWVTENKIQAPEKVTELENLNELMY